MRRPIFAAAATLVAAALLCTTPAEARPRAVGLGVGAGVTVPFITGDNAVGFDPAAAWGFYTDIPLLSSFAITPSTLVYTLDPGNGGSGVSATDVSLNFKFVVPLSRLDIFGGVTAGVTSTTQLDPHVGVLAGAQFNLVSNLDVFANVSYRRILVDGSDINNIQVFVGPLIRFNY